MSKEEHKEVSAEKYIEGVEALSDNAQVAVEKISKATRKLRHARKGIIQKGLSDRLVERMQSLQKLSKMVGGKRPEGGRLLGEVRARRDNSNPDEQSTERPRLFGGGLLSSFFEPSEEELKAQKEAEDRRKAEEERKKREIEEQERKNAIMRQQGMTSNGKISITVT